MFFHCTRIGLPVQLFQAKWGSCLWSVEIIWFLGVSFVVFLKVRSFWPPWFMLSRRHQQCSNTVFYLRDNLHWLDYDSLLGLYLPHYICLFLRRLKWLHLLDVGLLALSLMTSMSYNVDYLLANSELELFLASSFKKKKTLSLAPFNCLHFLNAVIGNLVRELPMISVSHVAWPNECMRTCAFQCNDKVFIFLQSSPFLAWQPRIFSYCVSWYWYVLSEDYICEIVYR